MSPRRRKPYNTDLTECLSKATSSTDIYRITKLLRVLHSIDTEKRFVNSTMPRKKKSEGKRYLKVTIRGH